MRVEHLVVDSSAFIHNGPIQQTGANIYTCREIINEIKDQATLDRLKFLPYELKILQIDKDDFKFCCEFAKKTGDYGQLSVADLGLITVTYCLEKKYNGDKYMNNNPKEISVKALAKTKYQANPMRKVIDDLNNKLEAANIEDTSKTLEDDELDAIMDNEAGSSSSDDEASDDGDEWIDSSNIDKMYQKMGYGRPESVTTDPKMLNRVTVACMTSDFSIQNCLLQMGLLVVSPVDGLMIKEAKRIALRCHACFKVFHDPSKIKNNFCPHCGNLDTLKRVQYVIDKNGEKRVLINFKRPIKVKGTNKQLPRPRGGKHANNPILAPDQRVRRDKEEKFTVQEKKLMTAEHILEDPAYLVRMNPFAQRSTRIKGRKSWRK